MRLNANFKRKNAIFTFKRVVFFANALKRVDFFCNAFFLTKNATKKTRFNASVKKRVFLMKNAFEKETV